MGNFESISHDQWLAKIKKELKTEDLGSFHTLVSDHISIDPFFGRKPEQKNGQRIVKSWQHKICIKASSIDNELLLEDLAGGIDYVEIQVDQQGTDWEKAFDGVIFEYIDLEFIIDDKDWMPIIEKELSSFNSDFRLSLSSSILQLDAKDYVAQLTEGFERIIRDLDQFPENEERTAKLKSYRINRLISPKIVEELALAEAIEVLSYNLCKGFGMEIFSIKSHASCMPMFEDVERNYIDLSMKGLIAGLAHYDAIFIDQAHQKKPSFHHRVSRNIHHLLKEESNLVYTRSAFKGAEQITKIRNKIAQAVWNKIR